MNSLNLDRPDTDIFHDDPWTRVPTPKEKREELDKVTEELKNATLEFMDLDDKDTQIKVKKAKAQMRLSLARDAFRNIRTI